MPLHDWQAIKLNGRTLKEIQKINILRWKYISMNFESGVNRLWKQKVLARYIKIIFYSVCLVFSDLLELNKGIHFNKTGSDSYYLFYACAPKVAGGIKFSVCPSFFFFFFCYLFCLFVCLIVCLLLPYLRNALMGLHESWYRDILWYVDEQIRFWTRSVKGHRSKVNEPSLKKGVLSICLVRNVW